MVFREPMLKLLAATGKAEGLTVRGVTGGFVLVLREQSGELVLEAKRGHARVFRSLDRLASYLREMGVATVTLELAGWVSRGTE